MKTLLIDSGREPIADIINIWSQWPDWELCVWTDRPEWYHQQGKIKTIEALPNWTQNLWSWKKSKLRLAAHFLILVTTADKLNYTERALKAGWPVVWLETPASDRDVAKLAKLSAKTHAVIVFTESMRDLRLQSGWANDNLKVCPPALSWLPKELKPEHNVSLKLGVVADLRSRQRLEDFLKLLGMAKEIGLFLDVTIIGDGPYRQQLLWLVKTLALERIVKIVGERQELDAWFVGFDYLVVANAEPGITDLLNGIKALAIGVPVLGPNVPVVCDLIKPGQSGEWLDWSAPDNNLALLKALADNPLKHKILSQGAKKQYADKFEVEMAREVWRKIFYQ